VTVTESPEGTDVSTIIYDDKGRKKDSLRAHEIHIVSDPNLDAKYETERARKDEGQRKIIDLQRQLEGVRSWQDEQTQAQAAYASGAYYTQAYSTPQYQGASTQAVTYISSTQATGYQTQHTNNTYGGKPNRGKDNPQKNKTKGPQQPRATTRGTFCFACGEEGHWPSSRPQNQPGQTLSIMNTPAPTQDTHNLKLIVVMWKTARPDT